MVSFIRFFIFGAALLAVASASGVNQTCSRNTDCYAQSSMCGIISPTCGSGICQCIPGFAYDSVSGNCKRAAYLGGACNPSGDVCIGDNMACQASGTCSCNFGFKQGLQGTDCVPNLMTQTAGDICHDSAQCYYSLVCVQNKCGCYSGYKSYGKYSCSPRQVYDSCSTNDDCSMAPNSACSNGRCDCTFGSRAIQYQADIMTKAYACIGTGEGIAGEGGNCNMDSQVGALVYCDVPFICSNCGTRSVCIRQQPILLSHASMVSPIFTVMLLPAFAVLRLFMR